MSAVTMLTYRYFFVQNKYHANKECHAVNVLHTGTSIVHISEHGETRTVLEFSQSCILFKHILKVLNLTH